MKRYLAAALAATLISNPGFAEQYSIAQGQASVAQQSAEENKQRFTLNLWAPDEVAPPEAKLAEIGDSYQYQYTPDELFFEEGDVNRTVVFRFHPDTNERYQFSWVTADHPEHMTLKKKRNNKIKIGIDDGAVADEMYFEVWVYDTQTGKRFMCDPKIGIGKPEF